MDSRIYKNEHALSGNAALAFASTLASAWHKVLASLGGLAILIGFVSYIIAKPNNDDVDRKVDARVQPIERMTDQRLKSMDEKLDLIIQFQKNK